MPSEYSLLTVLLASLLGSTHCIGMCGGFVVLSQQGGQPRLRAIAYNLGRLTTYLTLGAAAGALGRSLNSMGAFVQVQYLAGLLMGIAITTVGCCQLFGWRIPVPAFLKSCTAGPLRTFASLRLLLSPGAFAYLIGLSSTLLPCGWLYIFLTVAVGSADPLHGAVIMGVFWIGTLPALLITAGLVERMKFFGSDRARAIGAVLLIVTGLLSIAFHFDLVSFPGHEHHHHHH